MRTKIEPERVPDHSEYCSHSWVPVQDEPMAVCLQCHARKEIDQ